jgi:Zn-dependent protease with chaperone function
MSNLKQPSLAARAVLAVALMIGFYVLALGVAGGLLFIPYAEIRYAHRIHAKLALVCVAGAGVILWSIFPRRDKFVPPGPRIERRKHPRFFQELEQIAGATGQPVPEEAYLEMDVNAWVSQRDGFMGFGGKRVMAVGLPLLRILTVSQLRGVLGHEFGHYHGGDTRLGPWIYKTHEALFRTVQKLVESGSALRHIFIAYAKLFLRVSNAISRRQELAADQLAAGIVGSRAFGEGLRAVHQGGLAYQVYFRNECVPAFGNGFRPPLAEGFARFLSSKTIADAIDEAMGREAQEKHDPYRTHPPLNERLAAIASIPAEPGPGAPPPIPGDPPALSLLENVDAMEDQLLRAVFDAREVAKLKPIRWEDVGTQVYVPLWTKGVLEAKAGLAGLTPALLPERLPDLERLGRELLGKKPVDKKDARAHGATVLGAALAVSLVQRGWSLHADPGERVTLEQGGVSVSPFTLFDDLAEKRLTVDQWRATCAGAGISDLDLAAVSEEGAKKP